VALAKAVTRYVAEHEGKERIDFVTIGKNADRLAKRVSGNIRGSFAEFSLEQGMFGILGLARLVIDEFLSGRYKKVFLAYHSYVSAIRYEPTVRELLPVRKDESGAAGPVSADMRARRYLFEPDEARVLAEVLPRLTEIQLYQANLESMASEQSARMVAMKNASDSAGEMIGGLALDFNHARQDGITQEISEIAAGANALG
jgi:F-type H+-transporting ATPase subunit gamma